MVEKAADYNPKAGFLRRFLSMLYAQVDRFQESQVMFEKGFGKWPGSLKTIRFYMTHLPFKEHQIAERIAEGYVRAGLKGEPSDFYKISAENMLSGEEIKDLFFGRKVTGFTIAKGTQWWIERSNDGKAIIRQGETVDSGKSWVEEDMLCDQWDNLYENLKDCWIVYRNPEGSSEKSDEYLGAPGYGVYPFSRIE